MRWGLAALLLSGCSLFDWDWYEEVPLAPLTLDSDLPEAWVGWDATLHAIEDLSGAQSEWDEDDWEDDSDATSGLELAIGLRARLIPTDGPAEVRFASWGLGPSDLVTEPEMLEVPAEGATFETWTDWRYCDVGWSCTWFDERRLDLRSGAPVDVELTVILDGRTYSGRDRISYESYVEADVYWGQNP